MTDSETTVRPSANDGWRLRRVDSAEWDDVLSEFDDASIYQSTAYGAVHWGAESLEHWVLENTHGVAGGAQVRIVRAPVFGPVVAYVARGPIWRRKGRKPDTETLRSVLRALRDVYVTQRGLLLRVKLNEIDREDGDVQHVLRVSSLAPQRADPSARTLLIDLAPETSVLRMNLKKKWRESLNRAERREMESEEGTSAALYEEFVNVYGAMHDRKQFAEFVDIAKFGEMRATLQPEGSLHTLVCRHEGEPVCALVWSAIGDTGTIHFSGTAGAGLKLRGSYVLRWRALEAMKRAGLRYLDQGGVDPEQNPGGYQFKTGFGGDLVELFGAWEACERRRVTWVVGALSRARNVYRRFRRSGSTLGPSRKV